MSYAKISLLAPIALACSLSAQAANFDAGTLSPTPFFAANPVSGAFSDIYNFVIDGTHETAAASAVPLTLPMPIGTGNLYHISNFAVQVFDSANNSVGSLSFNSTLQDYVLQTTLNPGSYHATVTGTGDGLAGGFYSLALAAVPEPGGWAMMLAGVAAMGLVFRRRLR